MRAPYGLAFTAAGDLVVSDPLANRVLLFQSRAVGISRLAQRRRTYSVQPDFSSSLAGRFLRAACRLARSDDQLYVADTGNNRIAVLPNVDNRGR